MWHITELRKLLLKCDCEPCVPSLKHTSAHGSVQADEDAPQYHSTQKDEDHTKNQGDHTENNTANPQTFQNEDQNAQKEQNTAAAATVQNSSTPADQLTLQHDQSRDQGDLDLHNQGDVISIHGPSHKGPRALLVVHTVT